jgi:hypothetical protein
LAGSRRFFTAALILAVPILLIGVSQMLSVGAFFDPEQTITITSQLTTTTQTTSTLTFLQVSLIPSYTVASTSTTLTLVMITTTIATIIGTETRVYLAGFYTSTSTIITSQTALMTQTLTTLLTTTLQKLTTSTSATTVTVTNVAYKAGPISTGDNTQNPFLEYAVVSLLGVGAVLMFIRNHGSKV